MADTNPIFRSLDDGSGVGIALSKVLEGDAAAAKNASPALVAKDDSGDLIYLRTDSAGNLLISSDGAGICNRAGTDGTPVAGSTSKTTVVDISLTVAKVYRKLEWSVTNRRDTLYEIELIDDPAGTPSVVQSLEIIVGSGQYTDSGEQHCFEFDTTGLTAPVLRLSGTNFNNASDFRGAIAITEDAA